MPLREAPAKASIKRWELRRRMKAGSATMEQVNASAASPPVPLMVRDKMLGEQIIMALMQPSTLPVVQAGIAGKFSLNI